MKDLDLKPFEQYTKEEQKSLLHHWWHYYGKSIYTFDELEKFLDLVDKNPEQIMHVATSNFIVGDMEKSPRPLSNEILLECIRQNRTSELFSALPKLESFNNAAMEHYNKMRGHLLKDIVKTYNNPEKSVPVSISIISPQGKTNEKETSMKPDSTREFIAKLAKHQKHIAKQKNGIKNRLPGGGHR